MPTLPVTCAISAFFLDFFAHLSMGPLALKSFLMIAVLAGVCRIQGRRQKPPLSSEASPAPTVLLRDPAADLRDDNIEEVRINAPPHPGSGTGQMRYAEPASHDYEEEEEEGDDEEDETGSGGEETLDAMQHWKDEEAKAALTEV